MTRLTKAQRDVLTLMVDGAELRVKSGGFFPGAWVGMKRVHLNTARALMDRLLVRELEYSPRDGAFCRITDAGRTALTSAEASA